MKFAKYREIGQFRNVVKSIQLQSDYQGTNEEGLPIYEPSVKPVLEFTGTIKLHGTNAGVCYDGKTIRAQKRGSFLGENFSGYADNHFGFNQFVHTHQRYFQEMLEYLWDELGCNEGEQLTLYGEWAGEGIQKGVGISSLPKSFYYFGCKRRNTDDEGQWIDIHELFDWPPLRIYNIYGFPTYKIIIDFNHPQDVQNELTIITKEVERECPVTKQLGGEGIGEGVVWSAHWNGQLWMFKVKGEKHSVSKVKTLANVDVEILNSITDFVAYACTPNRIMQGIQEVGATEKSDTPALLRWVANDIIKEEADVLLENNLEWKQVARDFSNAVRQYYFQHLDDEVFKLS